MLVEQNHLLRFISGSHASVLATRKIQKAPCSRTFCGATENGIPLVTAESFRPPHFS
jgi:hypothetical protein